jgi:hypothetical protein
VRNTHARCSKFRRNVARGTRVTETHRIRRRTGYCVIILYASPSAFYPPNDKFSQLQDGTSRTVLWRTRERNVLRTVTAVRRSCYTLFIHFFFFFFSPRAYYHNVFAAHTVAVRFRI